MLERYKINHVLRLGILRDSLLRDMFGDDIRGKRGNVENLEIWL